MVSTLTSNVVYLSVCLSACVLLGNRGKMAQCGNSSSALLQTNKRQDRPAYLGGRLDIERDQLARKGSHSAPSVSSVRPSDLMGAVPKKRRATYLIIILAVLEGGDLGGLEVSGFEDVVSAGKWQRMCMTGERRNKMSTVASSMYVCMVGL